MMRIHSTEMVPRSFIFHTKCDLMTCMYVYCMRTRNLYTRVPVCLCVRVRVCAYVCTYSMCEWMYVCMHGSENN